MAWIEEDSGLMFYGKRDGWHMKAQHGNARNLQPFAIYYQEHLLAECGLRGMAQLIVDVMDRDGMSFEVSETAPN